MAMNGGIQSDTMRSLHRLNAKYEEQNAEVKRTMRLQMQGVQPDAAQFMNLLERHSVTQQAMEAQIKLHVRPHQTALNESR
ncbi:MAG TPA: hypothetical protein VIF60_08645 [Burkholderiaceae bacterium]|jgi:hypothetical protein